MTKKKASAKEAFLPFFVGDFFAATMEWEGEARSLYATLLLHQWAGGSIPADPKRICKIVKWDWELFQVHWRCVRRKFKGTMGENEYGEAEERLVNVRLEEHRKKTQELSEKNAASGAKGAEKRWGKDGESPSKKMASANEEDGERYAKNSERHKGSIASANDSDGERHAERHPKRDGVTDSNPSHPIPSHPNAIVTSSQSDNAHSVDTREAHALEPGEPRQTHEPQATNSTDSSNTANGAKALDLVVPDGKGALASELKRARRPAPMRDPVAEHAQFERVMAAYPEFAGAPQLILVEKACRARIDEGATWDELEAAARRFAVFVKAGGRSGDQYVETPLKFFGSDKWRDEWKPPRTKAQKQQDENVDASLQWLREQEGKDAAH